MPAKPKRGRGTGGSKTPTSTTKNVSSAASTNPVTTSPASVSRRTEPQQIQGAHSSGHVQNTPEISRNVRSRLTPPVAPTPQALAHTPPLQRPVTSIPRANSTNQVGHRVNEEVYVSEPQDEEVFAGGEREEGEGEDGEGEEQDSDAEEDDGDAAANEGLYLTLNALLTAPGRANLFQRLSPHIGEGMW